MRLVANSAVKDQTGSTVLYSEEKAGRFTLGFVTLARPQSRNALDLEMLNSIAEKLLVWREREDIACVVFHATSGRAFCAGGDIKSLVTRLRDDRDGAFARNYFTTEYFVDYLIHVYPKPILCWADGVTMGGGVGIMNGASCRVVTERSILAMPEITIGFFTDVGATYFLNRLPADLGLFLGLTGARFDGFDAVGVQMAEGVVHAEKKSQIFAGLARAQWTPDPQKNSETLHRYIARATATDPHRKSRLLKHLDPVSRLVNKASIEEIDDTFRKWQGKDPWIESAIHGYLAGSPTAAKTIFAQLRNGKELSLKQAFLREWDMAVDYCRQADVYEGARARLIDKDFCPRWNPSKLSDVQSREIERYFAQDRVGIHLLAEKIAVTGIEATIRPTAYN